MKKIVLLIIMAMILASCADRNVSVNISGDIQNGGNKMLRLALITAEGMDIIDSANMRDGHFEFKISSEDERIKERENAPMMFQLFLSEENSLATMAKKGERLKITADAEDMTRTYHISGGEEAMLMHQLDSSLTAFVIPTEKMYETYQKNSENDSVRAEIEAQYVKMLQDHKNYLRGFIQNHPDNMASYIAFFQSYNRRNFFDIYQDLGMLKQINNNLSRVYPESEYVKAMKNMANMIESRMSASEDENSNMTK
ncbi:MAG: DUF4369 domain-containing protein [Bacteroidales bacterium]|nr:DUF4369 domain-containing protein [Bacteroidales bacterium]